MKKVLATLLAVFLLATMIPLGAVSVSAASCTREEAVRWALNIVGASLDYDGVYGAQCVDLIYYYYQQLGVQVMGGDACDYAWNALPAGWQRIPVTAGFVPKTGDIAVWKTNYTGYCEIGQYSTSSLGHVGIIVNHDTVPNSNGIVGMMVVNQNFNKQKYCSNNWFSSADLQCVIRPNFVEPHIHSWSAWTVTKAATCTMDGQQKRTCGCGASETQAIPATGAHVYDDEYDASCNVCGGTREVPDKPITPVLPADAPAFVVENVTACEGEEFTVAIRTERNSGIVSFKLKLGYDADVLELVLVEEKDFASMSFSPISNNPFVLNWVDAIHPDNTTNGVVALLTFRVKKGAPIGKTDITLSYSAEDVYDQNFDNVGFNIENGSVEIVDYVSGDVNGDGNVNNKDLGLLQQYLNEWNVAVSEKAADANGDGKVNNKDLGLLQQYLNDWDVELG